MARIRTVKPEFWTSEQVAECSTITRLLFIGMWNFCDDGGNHPASLKSLKMQIFPSDDIQLSEISNMVNELVKHELITQYTVNNKDYWHVLGWHHQKIDKPNYKHPKYIHTDSQPFDNHSANDSQPFAPVRESKGMEGKGMELNTKEKNASEDFGSPNIEHEPDYLKRTPNQPHETRIIFGMTADWQPTESINALLMRNGLVSDYTKIDPDRLVDFVNHWLGKPDQKPQDGWHGALAGWLKRTQHDKLTTKQQPTFKQKQPEITPPVYKNWSLEPDEPLKPKITREQLAEMRRIVDGEK